MIPIIDVVRTLTNPDRLIQFDSAMPLLGDVGSDVVSETITYASDS